MGDRTLDYIALTMLLFVATTFVYLIIFLHDIPYEIAKKRQHPHQDAIHTAGWVSLFLMHSIWPFLWIWATLYNPELGWGFRSGPAQTTEVQVPPEQDDALRELSSRVASLEAQLQQQQEA